MKVAGPLVTLGAVAALGVGIYAVNVSKESGPAAPTTSTSQAAPPTSQAAPSTPAAPAAVPFPAAADYQGKVATKTGVITLDISVKGATARAYACDGNRLDRRGKQFACPQVFYSKDIVGQCVRFLGLFVKLSGGAGVSIIDDAAQHVGQAAYITGALGSHGQSALS